MKKEASVWLYLLFALTILYPVGVILMAWFGYSFELISISAFAIAIAALSVYIVIRTRKNTFENAAAKVLSAITAPLSLINAVFCSFECPQIWVIVSVWISVGCSGYLALKHGKPFALKLISLVLSVLMALPIGFISFVMLSFGNVGRNTIVQTIESPNSQYYAQVIDSDHGAMGGDTIVDVHKKSKINLILFRIEKIPQRVYFGDWGEWQDLQIYWKDDSCLVINSVEYAIE